MTRLGVLVSGRGSNLQAILEACADGSIDGAVVLVAGNRECLALEVARRAGVKEVRAYPLSGYGSSAERDGAMSTALRSAGVELVVCAGYDRVLDDVLVRAFEGAIINIHPSLLPEFGGTMRAISEAFEAGVPETGVTVHLIEPGTIDAGTILAQERVSVHPGDSLQTLEAKMHAAEHRLLPATIQAVIQGKLVRQG